LRTTISDPGTIDAATSQNADDDGSPGTTISCGVNSASPVIEMIRPAAVSSTVSFAPNPVSIRSL
jgi:hypothetical protein